MSWVLLSARPPMRRTVAVAWHSTSMLAIDAALISTATTDTICLINGCACCLVNDDLELQLSNLVAAGHYHQVVFEASGGADSAKLLRQLRHLPGLNVSAPLTLVLH
jgi:G3E family GTPase